MTPRRRALRQTAGAVSVTTGVVWLAWSTVDYQERSATWLVALSALVGYALLGIGYLLVLGGAAAHRLTDPGAGGSSRRGGPLGAPGVPASQPGAATAARADWLLGLRALAAALVFGMHAPSILRHDVTWGGSSLAWIAYSPAWLGMLLFFSLSGYLMGKGFHTGRYTPDVAGVRRFFASRALRIAPLVFVVALLVVILQVPEWLIRADLGVRLATFTLSSVQVPDVLVPLWSLSTEWHFYLLVPVLFLAVRAAVRGPLTLLLVTAVVILGGLLVRVVVWRTHGDSLAAFQFVYQPVYSNIEVFFLGVLANWWRPVLRRGDAVLARTWPVLLVGIVLGYSWIAYRAMQLQDVTYQAAFALIVPTVVAVLLVPILCGAEALSASDWASPTSKRYRATRQGLYWSGALTYPVYLVHLPVLSGLQAGIPEQPLVMRAALGLVLVLLVAAVLHLTVERSAFAWRRHLVQPPVRPEAVSDADPTVCYAEPVYASSRAT